MLFLTTLGQMAVLFALIALGYILVKTKRIPEGSESVLSKLETYVFLPALVLDTFAGKFTANMLSVSWKLVLWSVAVLLIFIFVSFFSVKLCSKDSYTQKIFLYGLSFSNFGFMGNAIVLSLFPDIFLEYQIFTLVLWIGIYAWGAPRLLIPSDLGGKKNRFGWIKNFANPMMICMVIGMAIGLSGIVLPDFAYTLVSSAGACMSPVAMILTGMTLAKMDILKLLKMKSVYIVSALRLIVYPLAFIGIYFAATAIFGISLPYAFVVCAVASIAMPLGLNTIVIPSAYGKDTTVASSMALISHALSIITIPIIFMVMEVIL
ncbi:MAG: hypothetical protein E7640_05255 [Ruminococcaceae bacterium]|nr:hypothetical protein [Oscillospiraceae bacterium]